MKPLKRIACKCGRAFATSRCEDHDGVRWLCDDCVKVWWQAHYDRVSRGEIHVLGHRKQGDTTEVLVDGATVGRIEARA